MNNLMESDFQRFIAVLVLDYLDEQQLQNAYDYLIDTSNYLMTEKNDLKCGKKPLETSIELVNIVRGYFLFESQMDDFLQTAPASSIRIQLIETDNLLDRLKIILNQVEKSLQASCSNSNEEKERNSIEDEFDDLQSNNLINSDIQRFVAVLVLDYLDEQQLQNAYDSLIDTSNYLMAEKNDLRCGKKPLETSIELVNIVRHYFLFESQMDDFLRTAPESPIKIQLIEIDNPLDRLRIILKLFKQNLQKSSPNSDRKRKHNSLEDDFDSEFTNPVKKLERISLRAPMLRLNSGKDFKNENFDVGSSQSLLSVSENQDGNEGKTSETNKSNVTTDVFCNEIDDLFIEIESMNPLVNNTLDYDLSPTAFDESSPSFTFAAAEETMEFKIADEILTNAEREVEVAASKSDDDDDESESEEELELCTAEETEKNDLHYQDSDNCHLHIPSLLPKKIFNMILKFKNKTATLSDSGEFDLFTIEPNPVVKLERVKCDQSQMDKLCKDYEEIRNNEYLKNSDRKISRVFNAMQCDCKITEEEVKNRELGCQDKCINRLIHIECGANCRCGKYCDNQQFQRYNYSACSVFDTTTKGFGIRADQDISVETFIIEYVGEVLDNKQFEKRAKKYSENKNIHYYFMTLQSNAIIDATKKGNISRFINHSCDPNAETQKWTVNGELRVGFFSRKNIKQGEEITFDYQYQRYGKEAQKCYCEATNCRGWIGENPLDEAEEEECIESPEIDEKKSKGRKKFTKKMNKLDKMIEDLEIEKEIRDLTISGLKNRDHTIKLARLVVRAKNLDARSRILKILINGDSECRRLFLDYKGLKLLHSWMTELKMNSIPDLELCIEIMNVLQTFSITKKKVLNMSRVLNRVNLWKKLDLESTPKNKQTKSEKNIQNPGEKAQLETLMSNVKVMASDLINKWEELKKKIKTPDEKKND